MPKLKKTKSKLQEAKASEVKTSAKPFCEPLLVSYASDDDYPVTRSRRNVAGITERSYKYKNIEDGLTPFRYDKNYNGDNTYSLYETIILCQKAYWNYGPLRNIIELMVDFSSTDLYLKGSTAKIRKFYKAWFNKVNLQKLVSQFFREYYRSGNVFLHPFKSKLKQSDLRDLVKFYGGNISSASAIVPVRYIILNPADIQVMGNLSVGNNHVYYKRLSDYELESLRNPRTDQDRQVFESLPPDIQKQVKTANVSSVLMPLPMKEITYIGYCSMPYEPFSLPLIHPVLEDINYKLELKKIDMALSRSVQQAMLLINLGNQEDGVNPDNMLAMQKLLESPTISRSIVADFDTKAQFISPDIGELLNAEKYTVVERDINTALNNILVGDEKFANQKNKIDVFIARLEQGRKVFLNEFLIPEMTKLAEEMGFDKVPDVYFDSITLTDDTIKQKNFTRLVELGILTPEMGIEAIETGRLPNAEELLEAQREYKKLREDNLFVPLVGGSRSEEAGRPSGTKGIPQSTKKVGQIGSGSVEDPKFDMQLIASNMQISSKLDNIIRKKLKSKFKLKELNEDQEALIPEIKNLVLANEEPKNWAEKCADYCDKPLDTNKERVMEVQDLAIKHQVNTHMASILFASKK